MLLLLSRQKEFEWNNRERAMVLGSFYWLHWALQLPGGLLARTFGAKRIFGLSNLFMFIMSIVMPFVTRWDIKGLIVARALQGFIGVRIYTLIILFESIFQFGHHEKEYKLFLSVADQ